MHLQGKGTKVEPNGGGTLLYKPHQLRNAISLMPIQKHPHAFIRYEPESYQSYQSVEKSIKFYEWANTRRSVRQFSDTPVPKSVIEQVIKTASTAPSGANKQPWHFCAVSSPAVKAEIRKAAENEEQKNYAGRMNEQWLEDLKPFRTDWRKPFLETAPWLIVVMAKPFDLDDDGRKKNNYYVRESVGLASGMLLMALHNAGLVALTHTPSPMNFLMKILDRPANEKPFLLIPVGYPHSSTVVPDLQRKPLHVISTWYEGD